jgi:histidinol phosphatase-like PHP family hydrolase
MIDLHTHTFFSDGELGLAELARRAEVAGYHVLGVADHADSANLDFLVPRLCAAARELSAVMPIAVLAGVELTHVPPALIGALVTRARGLGANFVAVHGETIIEPTAPGTNRAAIEAGADFVAHPGLISREDAARAAERGVYLEITTRRGHAYTHGHVLQMARATGAALIMNNDAHAPGDLLPRSMTERIAAGAGMTPAEIDACFEHSRRLADVLHERATARAA